MVIAIVVVVALFFVLGRGGGAAASSGGGANQIPQGFAVSSSDGIFPAGVPTSSGAATGGAPSYTPAAPATSTIATGAQQRFNAFLKARG